jgi:hypothetical protein
MRFPTCTGTALAEYSFDLRIPLLAFELSDPVTFGSSTMAATATGRSVRRMLVIPLLVAVQTITAAPAVVAGLPILDNIDVWPLPTDVRAGASVGRIDPSNFKIVLNVGTGTPATVSSGGLQAAASSSSEACCDGLVLPSAQRLLRTLFLAEHSTEAYRRVAFPPLVNGSTAVEALLQAAGVKNPLADLVEFERLEVHFPKAQKRPITPEDLATASETYILDLQAHSGTLTAGTEVRASGSRECYGVVRCGGRKGTWVPRPKAGDHHPTTTTTTTSTTTVEYVLPNAPN